MPIYEYQCNSCGHELEKLQRMSDDALRDCPACEESDLKRLISAAGFRLKGAGWYETDFKKDNRRNLAESHSEKSGAGKSRNGASKETPKSGNGKETKPAAKPEAKSAGKSDAA